MNKNHFALMALVFVIGILAGVYVPRLYSAFFITNNPAAIPGITQIKVPEANKLFNDYYVGAPRPDSAFKGFWIQKDQLQALSLLAKAYPNFAGFRIYMGPDSPVRTRIFVGVTSADRDDITCIYRTTSGTSDPCPPICDTQSPITSR
jgi:hypothetical protein